MAWADKDKQAALEAIDKIVADTGLSVRKAMAEVSRMSGISVSTLEKWRYTPKDSTSNTKNGDKRDVTEKLKKPDVKTVFVISGARVGRPRKYETPDDLRKACDEYFEWCQANPLMEYKIVGGQVAGIPKLRAWTMKGLCLSIGLSESAWANYRNNTEFMEVIHGIEALIYDQKFTGAAADLLNANIISRDLGLMDKQHVTTAGEKYKSMSNEQLADKLKELTKYSRENTVQKDTEDTSKIVRLN